jgi:ferrous iron transport protein A
MPRQRKITKGRAERPLTLADLKTGRRGILERLDLPDDMARRLMELGFLPGHEIVAGKRAPGGGPRIFRVDGSEVALRDETAVHLYLRTELVDNAGARDAELGAAREEEGDSRPESRRVSASLALDNESAVIS